MHAFSSSGDFQDFSRVPNRLNPYQERCSIGPDLDPNRLKRLTADENKSPLAGKELTIIYNTKALKVHFLKKETMYLISSEIIYVVIARKIYIS